MCSATAFENVITLGGSTILNKTVGKLPAVGNVLAPKKPLQGLLSGKPTDPIFKEIAPNPVKPSYSGY
jgi:hypothetical protein